MTFTRRPRGAITVNGEEVEGWLEIETEENEFSAPDSFRVSLAMAGLPLDRAAKWWSEIDSPEVEIFAGLPSDPDAYSSADLTSIFFGVADAVEFNWNERVIVVTGRDLTGRLIDDKTAEKFVNLTASEIVAKFAAKHGLEAEITATTEKAGKFYQIDHVDLQTDRTAWDLITWLAQREGFAAFVRGKKLHFGPRPTLDDAPAFIIRRSEATYEEPENGNFVRLATFRDLAVSGDIRVTVKTWNPKRKKAYTKTASAGRSGGQTKDYSYTVPGLTPDEAEARAKSILADLSRHALRLEYEGLARATLHIGEVILLEGTGTVFDQTYFPDLIVRRLSKSDGFTWTINAKNRAAEDEPTL